MGVEPNEKIIRRGGMDRFVGGLRAMDLRIRCDGNSGVFELGNFHPLVDCRFLAELRILRSAWLSPLRV